MEWLIQFLKGEGKMRRKKKNDNIIVGVTIEEENKFVVSLANELFRMYQNLQNMDSAIRGVNNLKNRADSMMALLRTKGYEIPPLLGETYNEGYNMIASMELDENLQPGTKIIKRVIKPQVNYKGTMLQAAEIIVAYNE